MLDKLGVKDCFDDIICFESLMPSQSPSDTRLEERTTEANSLNKGVICKPSPEAMQRAIQIACVDPHSTVKIIGLFFLFHVIYIYTT